MADVSDKKLTALIVFVRSRQIGKERMFDYPRLHRAVTLQERARDMLGLPVCQPDTELDLLEKLMAEAESEPSDG